MSQARLLASRRFGALFFTQFLGAFNDNLFKNALVILVAYRSLTVMGLGSDQLVVLAGGIFILPFFLFSATAGQISDKVVKRDLIRWVKAAEIVVMALGALGFMTGDLGLLLGVLFLMGLQSTFFGPAKYSILPELLESDELVGGNALVETGTFVAILLGTIAGGVLIGLGDRGPSLLAAAVVVVAALGFATSLFIEHRPPMNPELVIDKNPITPALETLRLTRANRSVYLSILGISWFWFLGAALLSLLPSYCKDVLHASEQVVTLCLSLFCVGIALGSLLCERMSGNRLELGLVPLGSAGMTLFAADLFFVGAPAADTTRATLLGVGEFLGAPGGLRIAADLLLFSVFSGFFTVPLYTMVQERSAPSMRARVIAGNNILNALFMVLSAVLLMALMAADLSIPQLFGVLAVLNAIVAFTIYQIIPEFALRFVIWMLCRVMYRLTVNDGDRIPREGPVVLVCNHISFVDWLLVTSACRRPPRFVMYHRYFHIPVVGWFFRDGKVIPIAPAHEDEGTLNAAFDQIARELENGEVVCIFPEGKVTRDGRMNPFRTGIERIIARTPVPVVPMGLIGMWGSAFSHQGAGPFRRYRARLTLNVGEPIAPTDVTAAELGRRVAALAEMDPPAVPDA